MRLGEMSEFPSIVVSGKLPGIVGSDYLFTPELMMGQQSRTSSGNGAQALLAGAGLNVAAKQLKVAFPKKRQEDSTTIVVEGKRGTLEIRLSGAAVGVPAVVESTFVCQIPWLLFKQCLFPKPKDAALLRFAFAAGWFSVDSLRTSSPQILFDIARVVGRRGGNAELLSAGCVKMCTFSGQYLRGTARDRE